MRLTKKSIDFNRRSDNNLNIITKQLYYINVDLKRLKGVCLRYDTPSSVFFTEPPYCEITWLRSGGVALL